MPKLGIRDAIILVLAVVIITAAVVLDYQGISLPEGVTPLVIGAVAYISGLFSGNNSTEG